MFLRAWKISEECDENHGLVTVTNMKTITNLLVILAWYGSVRDNPIEGPSLLKGNKTFAEETIFLNAHVLLKAILKLFRITPVERISRSIWFNVWAMRTLEWWKTKLNLKRKNRSKRVFQLLVQLRNRETGNFEKSFMVKRIFYMISIFV